VLLLQILTLDTNSLIRSGVLLLSNWASTLNSLDQELPKDWKLLLLRDHLYW